MTAPASTPGETRLTPGAVRVLAPVVAKFGGELLEDRVRLEAVVGAIARFVASGRPLVVVHGGGKEIDAALHRAGIATQQVDGLRVTDPATLDAVVAVVGGTVNTRLVAALVADGVPAVGLTGVDAACGLADVAPPHHAVDGRIVELGEVGVPSALSDPRLLNVLVAQGFVPVVACLGLGPGGRVLNVNADTLAGHLAGLIGATRLVIAGTTPGVLDDRASTIDELDRSGIARLVSSGTASAGMVAKLVACQQAITAGVRDVVIVDGTDGDALEAALCSANDSRGRAEGEGRHKGRRTVIS